MDRPGGGTGVSPVRSTQARRLCHHSVRLSLTRSPIVAVLLAVALIVQPAVAMACARPLPGAGEEPAQSSVGEEENATPQAAVRAEDRPVSENDPGRILIALRLVDLGFTASEARQAALELTDDDIAILLDNEQMMQRAGGLSNLGAAYLIGTLIVVGIIILAANGSGFVTTN